MRWGTLLTVAVIGCRGATPSGTDAGDDAGAPDAGPLIKYVLVLVKENHTFDSYFADYDGGVDRSLVASLSDGGTRPLFPFPSGPIARDLDHTHPAAFVAWNDGGMNGFGDVASDMGSDAPFGYFPASAVGMYHAMARDFVLCDRFFTNTLGPSFPGHTALVAAQTPAISNPFCVLPGGVCPTTPHGDCDAPDAGYGVHVVDPDTCVESVVTPCFDLPTVVDALPAGFTWRGYGSSQNGRYYLPFRAFRSTGESAEVRDAHYRDEGQLTADLLAGDQANVTFAHIEDNPVSEHPPDDICPGIAFTADVLNAISQGPHWYETVVVLTWDDWGGFYDHVPPPVQRCANGAAYSNGFRVPTLIVSPYARRGYVLHTTTEQASVPRLIEELFGMPFLADRSPHARDRDAGSLLEALDFTQPPRPPPTFTSTCQ